MNILFISNSYVERSLFNYLKREKKHRFIFLATNHPDMKDSSISNFRFVDIEEALKLCNSIYIFLAHNISNCIIDKCKKAAADRGIQIFIDTTEYNNNLSTHIKNITQKKGTNSPCILILQLGHTAQIEKTELDLCYLLKNNNIKFSLYTNSWVEKVGEMAKILNLSSVYDEDGDEQLSILTLKGNVLNLISNDIKNLFFDEFMRTIKPDYIIMCCENDYKLQNKINDIFVIKFSRNIDTFIKSEYVSLKFNNNKGCSLFIENRETGNLFDSIKLKLTFPKGIKEASLDTSCFS